MENYVSATMCLCLRDHKVERKVLVTLYPCSIKVFEKFLIVLDILAWTIFTFSLDIVKPISTGK